MTIADDTPATVDNDRLQSEQVCFNIDPRGAPQGDAIAEDTFTNNQDYFVDGGAPEFRTGDNFFELEFEFAHSIEADDLWIQYRVETSSDGDMEIDVELNGTSITPFPFLFTDAEHPDVEWADPLDTAGLGWDITTDIEPGETNRLRFEVVDADGAFVAFDRIAVYDQRYESELNFDNTVDSNEQLSGPELFANEVPIELSQTETRRDVTEANIESTWDDTSNGQYIELRIGDDAFSRSNNSETASTTGGPARSIDVTLGLSRHGTRTDDTPTEGFLGQSVDTYELFANPAAVFSNSLGTAEVDAVIPPGSVTNDRLEESGQLASDDSLLTRNIMAPFDVFENMEIRSSEKVGFDND